MTALAFIAGAFTCAIVLFLFAAIVVGANADRVDQLTRDAADQAGFGDDHGDAR